MSSGRIKKIMLPLLIYLTSISLACASFILTLYDSKDDSNQIVEPNIDSIKKATAYILDEPEVIYSSVESALNVAQSGDIVTLIPPSDGNYPSVATPNKVTYTVSENCIIKPGVTLLIPTDSASVSSAGNNLNSYIDSMQNDDHSREASDYSKFATTNPNRYLRVTLEVSNNVTIYNYGNIIVSGYLSSGTSNAGMLGQTSHSYSQILLGKNARIVQETSQINSANDAKIYCFGYISEKEINNDSQVIVSNGSLYIPFIVNDYRGFQFSWAMTASDGALENGCSPFNVFEFANIDSKLILNYNSTTYSFVNLYVNYSAYSISETFGRIVNLVGNTEDFVFQFNSNLSYVQYKYDRQLKKASVDFFGGLNLNNLTLSFSAGGFGQTITIDLSTSNSFFPISYKFDITLNKASSQSNNAIYNFSKQRLKILPGSTFIVNDGCMITANEIIIYSAFYDGTLGNTFNTKCAYDSVKYPLKDGANFILNGNATININNIAGNIFCNNASNIIFNGQNEIDCLEPWQFINNSGIGGVLAGEPAWAINVYLHIREQLKIVSTDNLDKEKISVGINCFDLSYIPSLDIIVNYENNSSDSFLVDGYQKVLFCDNIASYSIDFNKNIALSYTSNNYYEKGSVVTYNDANSIIAAMNSTLSISSNNNGINEFDVQSIEIVCLTDLINGVVPLFLNKTIALAANVVDINKVYNKTIVWESLTPNTVRVNQEGIVTGLQYGDAIIKASCDGISAIFETKVIDESSIDVPELVSVEISGEKSFEVEEGQQVEKKYSISIAEEGAIVTNIKWKISGGNSGLYHNFIDPVTGEKTTELSGMDKEVTIQFSDPGVQADKVTLTCTVSNETTTVADSIQIEASRPCLLPGSLITMADGSSKPIEELGLRDMIKSFSFVTGQYEEQMIIYYKEIKDQLTDVITVHFDDGSEFKIAQFQSLFDMNELEYFEINTENYKDVIGKQVMGYDNGKVKTKTIINTTYEQYQTSVYEIITSYNYNFVADNTLTVDPLIGDVNLFEINDNLTYDFEQMQQDIATYGLYTYEDFKPYATKEQFELYNVQYLKVAVGKGLLTFDFIINSIERYKKYSI